ncbi:MAG: HDIG domain-containing metalloprotein [candidate division WOR-3 bacterium]
MDRETAWNLINSSVKNQNLIKHMLATEACLRALARRLGQDEEKWGLAGLVHDLDYEQTKDDPASHGMVAAQLLANHNVDPEVVQAVKAHSGNVEPVSLLDKAIVATDPVTGLIVAAALMHPTKKLANVDTEFVLRRFKDKRFAAGANREQIQRCSELGLSLEEFVTICLGAMRCIAGQLGL